MHASSTISPVKKLLSLSLCQSEGKLLREYRLTGQRQHVTQCVPFRDFESEEQRIWIRSQCKGCHNYVYSLDASQVNSTKASAPALK